MLDSQLLACLRCPESRQTVSLASSELLAKVNAQITSGSVTNVAGRAVSTPLEAALIREDALRLYPIIDGIPVMLLDESIILNP